jgi:hypothetical protein
LLGIGIFHVIGRGSGIEIAVPMVIVATSKMGS